jgi:uncharacterized protein (DUF1015 family)
MRIKAFRAIRPSSNDLAKKVAAVPYDVVDTEEARGLASASPLSFLHVSRAEIDFPSGTNPYSDQVYRKAAENFQKMMKHGTMITDKQDSCYVYRQKMGDHVQRGIVTCCHVGDYEKNVILRHEKTRQDKEDDRTRHLKEVGANTGPVFLAYKDVKGIDHIVAEVEKGNPVYHFTAVDGIEHVVWNMGELSSQAIRTFERVPVCYVADGHHRAAAAVRAGIEKRQANPAHKGDEEYNWFLAVLFPGAQLRILPYNRCVSDLNGMTQSQFLEKARSVFKVTENAAPSPGATRNVSMYLDGKWFGLSWDADVGLDPVTALDVSILQNKLLSPVLGINDPRTDKRIDFVGGIRGAQELAVRVDSGKAAVAFSLHPVTIDQVMSVADAGLIMPPKSTWFEPKLRSGLLIHTI